MKPAIKYTIVFDGDESEDLRRHTMKLLQMFMDYGMTVSEAIPVAVELAIDTNGQLISEKQLDTRVHQVASNHFKMRWN